MTVELATTHAGARPPEATRVVDALAAMLAEEGTETVFCFTGDGNLELLAALTQDHRVRAVHARHEQGAVAIADGYSRFSGRPGVCTVTQGPGLSNTATSLATAGAAGSAVVLVAADVAAADVHHVQRFDQGAFVRSTGCRFVPVHSTTLAADVSGAFRHVRRGGGPVVLNAPMDVQQQPHREHTAVQPSSTPPPAVVPSPAALTAAADELAAARRPVLVAGRGVVLSPGGPEAIRALADMLGAPVATTFMAHGLVHDHPLALGLAGGFSTPLAAETLANADCIVALGASLNAWTTGGGSLIDGTKVIQVDTDPEALGRITPVRLPLHGDAALTCGELQQRLGDHDGMPRQRDPELMRRLDAQRPAVDFKDGQGVVDPRRALTAVDQLLGEDRLVVLDTGHFAIFALEHVRVFDPRRFALTLNFAAIGQGLPVAIGAAFARPGERVTAIVGDGGFLMALYELETAIRYQLPLTVFVINDGGYGQERHSMAAKGLPAELADYGTPDLASVAVAMGAAGLRVQSPGELDALPQALSDARGPLVVDVRVNPEVVSPTVGHIAERMRGAH